METTAISSIDQQIEKYKAAHGGNKPMFIIMSAEEADEVTDALKERNGESEENIVTTYKDIKIVRNNMMTRGEYVLSNELPAD